MASGRKYSYSTAGLTYTDSLYVYVKNKAGKSFSLIRWRKSIFTHINLGTFNTNPDIYETYI